MLKLTFPDSAPYVANTSVIPERWRDSSFADLDFTGKEKLRQVLADYLKAFSLEGHDSLLLHSSDFAYELFVALYREIASRIPVNTYRFIEWPLFASSIRRGIPYLNQFYDITFLFLFDLTLSLPEWQEHFGTILSHCYDNGIRLLVVTRLDGYTLPTVLPQTVLPVYQEKILRIGISHAS